MSRRRARELALRILYWHEQANGEINEVVHKVLDAKKYPDEDKKFTRKVVEMTVNQLNQIDQAIVRVIKNWDYSRVSMIDKLIIRIAACEMIYFRDIPHEVSMNEAIEIGKKYGDADSPKFINGVLDAIACNISKKEEKKKNSQK